MNFASNALYQVIYGSLLLMLLLVRASLVLPWVFRKLQRYFGSREQRFESNGYVYLVYLCGGGGHYKIGKTKNVANRVKQLAAQTPFEVELVHTIPCSDYDTSEKTLHAQFARRRTKGEWYALSEDDVRYIRSIAQMRGSFMEHGA